MRITTDYSDYSVCVSTDPSHYGSNCTTEEAREIAPRLAQMIESQFAGIRIRSGGENVTGPDRDVIEEIRQWVEANWTAAL